MARARPARFVSDPPPDFDRIAPRLERLAIELPSWGFADTGTRFGKYLQDAAALTIDDKLDDAAHVQALTGARPAVAIHVQWDVADPADPAAGAALAALAARRGLRVGSVNPNLFQDQCYRHGSVTSEDADVRRRAIDHLLASVRLGQAAGSRRLSLWFADGTSYPGQGHLRRRKRWMQDALRETHAAMPESMTMLVEYKPFEPAFYHTDIADWGMACALARAAGPRAKVLVDTGHHLPGANVEHLVAFLIDEGMLGGFHFNDRHYADDDLTVGAIDPHRAFRIFFEIAQAEREAGGASGGDSGGGGGGEALDIAYTIDQSHNVKPKIEAMIQTVTAVQALFARALLVDFERLERARRRHDVVDAEETLRAAFWTDVRPALAAWRAARGLPADPLAAHRDSGYAERAAAERRGRKTPAGDSYA